MANLFEKASAITKSHIPWLKMQEPLDYKDESQVYEALSRGLISEEQAQKYLQQLAAFEGKALSEGDVPIIESGRPIE